MSQSIYMAADSTQEISCIRKRKKKSIHKRQKQGKLSGKLSDSDDDLHLSKELFPIESYLNNKPELVNQLFSIISKQKLANILPSILCSIDIDKLKQLCVKELNYMSNKRINLALRGIDPSSISSSDSEFENDICGNSNMTINESKVITDDYLPLNTHPNQDPILNPSETCRFSGSEDGEIIEIEKRLPSINPSENPLYTDLALTDISAPQSVVNGHAKRSSYIDNSENKLDSDVSLISCNKMEILELEMRARAIKSMLNRAKADLLHLKT